MKSILILSLAILSTSVFAEEYYTINVDNQCNASVKIHYYDSRLHNSCSIGWQEIGVGKTAVTLQKSGINQRYHYERQTCYYTVEPEWSVSGEWGWVRVSDKNEGKTMTCKGTVNTIFEEPCKCNYTAKE